MTVLNQSLNAYPDHQFNRTLKQELIALPSGSLPLQHGTNQGGMVDDSNLGITIINHQLKEGFIDVKVGVFFTEVIGGCSCGDDPLTENTYCEIRVRIKQIDGTAQFLMIRE